MGLALDEFNESLWRLALQAEHALGMRECVTRRYRELTRTLDEQLGLQPSQETVPYIASPSGRRECLLAQQRFCTADPYSFIHGY
jgi:DNA-binding SARP family transcriptional activator